MRIVSVFLIVLVTFFFSACASKEVFEPKNVVDDWDRYDNSGFTIEDMTHSAALVDDEKVLVRETVVDVTIKEDYKLLGYSDGWVLSSNIDGNLTLNLVGDTAFENLNLKRTIASASVKDDILAVLFTSNEMALYEISTKKLLLKEQGDAPIVVNSKIVEPIFKDNLVIFSTLDGKIVIMDVQEKKKLRTVIVSGEEYFNNVIYFNIIDNKIIASTGHKILSLAKKEHRVKHDIRNVIDDGETIYITTKQGEIISLTPDLQQNNKVKFPFAHFLGLAISNDKIYALEKEGYIIELSKDLMEYSIYEVDIDDGYIFVSGKIFYVDDEYISVE